MDRLIPFRHVSALATVSLLLLVPPGCGTSGSPPGSGGAGGSGTAGDAGDGGNGGNGGNGGGDDAPLHGAWEGTAEVVGGQFLKTGSFPATISFYESGSKVRGLLEIEQQAAQFAETFGYYFEGDRNGDVLDLVFTDRHCGAAEPAGICYPAGLELTMQKVFTAKGTLSGDAILLEYESVLDGISYPDAPVEPPFATVAATFDDAASEPGGVPIAAAWAGRAHGPFSAIYPNPIPMFGENRMTVEEQANGGHLITEFENNGVNIPEEVILADTFRYDDTSGRFWFVQVSSIYSRLLYVGEKRDNLLTGQIYWDDLEESLWTEDKAPLGVFDFAFEDQVGTFTFAPELRR